MKKFFIMAVWVALVATPAMAVTVVNSAHDMIASGFATATGGNTEVCVFCHTPHSAQSTVTLAPLWNNATVDATSFYGAVAIPGSEIDFPTDLIKTNATDARLCLACHDSGVGMPINGPPSVTYGTGAAMSANALLGKDLSNDHPIGMDLGPNPETKPTSGESGLHTLLEIRGSFAGEDPFFGGDPDAPDGINIMYCSSCHDVHDSDPLMKPFLRISNVGSALCKACHKK